LRDDKANKMGNFYSRQRDGMVPTPSGRSVAQQDEISADVVAVKDVIIDNVPDKTADEFNPQEHIISLIKMQKYYTEEERVYFWDERSPDFDEKRPDMDGDKADETEMPKWENVNDIYTNPNDNEDNVQGNIRRLFPVAIKQNYSTELENINEIIAFIESYKSDIGSALGKLEQDADSPLFVSILSHRNAIFDHIESNYPQYMNQICWGVDVSSCSVMYENRHAFEQIFHRNYDQQCVKTLFTVALDMSWYEEKLRLWFDRIKSDIQRSHLDHFRKIVHQEFERLTIKYPSIMDELMRIVQERSWDKQDNGQA